MQGKRKEERLREKDKGRLKEKLRLVRELADI
jgi:hypothetical protein